jgi:hypothetical protein
LLSDSTTHFGLYQDTQDRRRKILSNDVMVTLRQTTDRLVSELAGLTEMLTNPRGFSSVPIDHNSIYYYDGSGGGGGRAVAVPNSSTDEPVPNSPPHSSQYMPHRIAPPMKVPNKPPPRPPKLPEPVEPLLGPSPDMLASNLRQAPPPHLTLDNEATTALHGQQLDHSSSGSPQFEGTDCSPSLIVGTCTSPTTTTTTTTAAAATPALTAIETPQALNSSIEISNSTTSMNDNINNSTNTTEQNQQVPVIPPNRPTKKSTLADIRSVQRQQRKQHQAQRMTVRSPAVEDATTTVSASPTTSTPTTTATTLMTISKPADATT